MCTLQHKSKTIYHISLNRHHTQIVATQSESPTEVNAALAMANICGTRTCVQIILQTTVNMLEVGLFVLYNSFPWLKQD